MIKSNLNATSKSIRVIHCPMQDRL